MRWRAAPARLGASVLAACLSVAPAAAAPRAPSFTPIPLDAKPITEFRIGSSDIRFGALEFRGGLVLTSTAPDFGSLSGIDFSPDGATLYAVADTGFWFAARPVEANGRLVGLDASQVGPILGKNGRPVAGKRDGDAEGLRIVEKDGKEVAIVSFEQISELRQFVAAPDFASGRSRVLKLPSMKGVRRNQGLEAVAVAPIGTGLSGAIVLIAERSLDKNGNHRAWIVGGKRAGAFSLRRSADFDVTDAVFLPDGDLLVLERRFTLTGGIGMRLRRIAAADIAPEATVDGPALIEADMRYQIDNMEGLAVRPGQGGETLIAIVSDNNHNILQRTILLYFTLLTDAADAPAEGPETAERP